MLVTTKRLYKGCNSLPSQCLQRFGWGGAISSTRSRCRTGIAAHPAPHHPLQPLRPRTLFKQPLRTTSPLRFPTQPGESTHHAKRCTVIIIRVRMAKSAVFTGGGGVAAATEHRRPPSPNRRPTRPVIFGNPDSLLRLLVGTERYRCCFTLRCPRAQVKPCLRALILWEGHL